MRENIDQYSVTTKPKKKANSSINVKKGLTDAEERPSKKLVECHWHKDDHVHFVISWPPWRKIGVGHLLKAMVGISLVVVCR